MQHLKSQLPAVSVKLIELLLLSSAHSVQLTYCDWIKIPRGRQSTCCVEIKEGSKDMKIKSLKQNVAIDFYILRLQHDGTSWPQFCRYSGLQTDPGADGSGDSHVWQERSPHWGHLSTQDFCTGLWTFLAGRYFVIGIRTIRIVLQILIHNGCKRWSNAFGGLSGAFVFWAHWGLPSWSGAAEWEHTGRRGRGSGCEQRAAFYLLEKTSLGWRSSRLPPLPHEHDERQEDEAVTGRRWVGDGTAKPSQLSFVEEVENNSVSVPLRLQGGWSRAELANSCWKAWWDSGELEQTLARVVFVVFGVCSPRFHSCPSREIR